MRNHVEVTKGKKEFPTKKNLQALIISPSDKYNYFISDVNY